jgi:hypothetical protein
VHAGSDSTYGSTLVTKELRRRGYCVNHKRVERLMAQNGIVGVTPRRFVRTTLPAKMAPDIEDLPSKGIFGALSFFNGTAETRPATRVGDARLVITMVAEKFPIVGHDQQHGCASLAHTERIAPSSQLVSPLLEHGPDWVHRVTKLL